MSIKIIPELSRKYIRGSEKGAIVQMVRVFVCNLTNTVVKGIDIPCNKVHINTRVLKHTYDKRTAEEFDFLIENIHLIIKYPDSVYKNKDKKRGQFCFVKNIKDKKYLCSIEVVDENGITACEVATFFRTTDEYVANYELLWEWKGGNLHRNAFDSGVSQPNNTPQ